MDLADQEDDLHRSGNAAEQVGGGGGGRDCSQQGIAEDEAETFRHALNQLGVPALGRRRLWLGRADRSHGHGGNEEAPGIDRHGGGTPDGLDEATRHTRTGHRRHLCAAGELGVALHQMFPTHQRREVRLIGDIEEDGENATGQSDDEELDEGQSTDGVGDRDGAQGENPSQVRADHETAAAHTIHPHPGWEADDEKGRGRRRREQPHFEGRGVQRLHGQERDGEQAHLRAQFADGLAAPEQPEVPVASEGSLGHRRTITRGGHLPSR